MVPFVCVTLDRLGLLSGVGRWGVNGWVGVGLGGRGWIDDMNGWWQSLFRSLPYDATVADADLLRVNES